MSMGSCGPVLGTTSLFFFTWRQHLAGMAASQLFLWGTFVAPGATHTLNRVVLIPCHVSYAGVEVNTQVLHHMRGYISKYMGDDKVR